MTSIMDEIKQRAKATMQGPNGALVPGPGGIHFSAQNNQTLDTELGNNNMGRGFDQHHSGLAQENQFQGLDNMSGMGQAGHAAMGSNDGATGLNNIHTGLTNNNTGLAESDMSHSQRQGVHMGTTVGADGMRHPGHTSSVIGSGMGQDQSHTGNELGTGRGYDHPCTHNGLGSGVGQPHTLGAGMNMNQAGNAVSSNGSTMGTGMTHTHGSTGMGHHHLHHQALGTTAGSPTGTCIGASDVESQGHGKGTKVSSATKGTEYDATAGAVDDRTAMQKLKDKLTPGSDVGKHCKA